MDLTLILTTLPITHVDFVNRSAMSNIYLAVWLSAMQPYLNKCKTLLRTILGNGQLATKNKVKCRKTIHLKLFRIQLKLTRAIKMTAA